MTSVAATGTATVKSARIAPSTDATSKSAYTSDTLSKNKTPTSAKASPAAVVDLSAAAKGYLTGLTNGTSISTTLDVAGVQSFDEMVQGRTKTLADKISAAFKSEGIPLDEPINLKLDSIGNVTTDSPYKKKIEQLFKDDPDLAKEFKDVAGLNAMKAAQQALEAFVEEKKAARNDDERDAAQGRFTGRLMRSQDLSGMMTLDDGKLRSWSVAFMDASLGKTPAAEASSKAKAIAAQRTSITV